MRDARSGQALSQLPGTELHSTAMAELTDAASLWNSIWTSAARGHLTQQFLVADLVSVRESRALGVARTPGPAQQRRAEPLPRAFVGVRNSRPPSLFRRLSSRAALDSSVWVRWQVRVKLAMTLRSFKVQEILALESGWEVRLHGPAGPQEGPCTPPEPRSPSGPRGAFPVLHLPRAPGSGADFRVSCRLSRCHKLGLGSCVEGARGPECGPPLSGLASRA